MVFITKSSSPLPYLFMVFPCFWSISFEFILSAALYLASFIHSVVFSPHQTQGSNPRRVTDWTTHPLHALWSTTLGQPFLVCSTVAAVEHKFDRINHNDNLAEEVRARKRYLGVGEFAQRHLYWLCGTKLCAVETASPSYQDREGGVLEFMEKESSVTTKVRRDTIRYAPPSYA